MRRVVNRPCSWSRRPGSIALGLGVVVVGLLAVGPAGRATQETRPDDDRDPSDYSVEETRLLLWSGDYARCRTVAEANSRSDPWTPAWRELAARAQAATGDYAAARVSVEEAISRLPTVASLRVLGSEILLRAGEAERSSELLEELVERAERSPWGYRRPADRVAVGLAHWRQGMDARQVLNEYFRPAKKEDPSFVGALVAIARVALEKTDDALAGDEIQAALELEARDPELHYLMARAFAGGDTEVSERALERALELNPRHVPSRLLRVQGLLHSDQLDLAEQSLDEILEIEPGRWEAWADLAAISELRADSSLAEKRGAAALGSWTRNPRVDHRIGAVLSRNYRFREAAAHQRKALEFDPGFAPARFALAQDLLRLGEEEEGWRLAEQVLEEDPYDIVAYNLMTLHDRLKGYTTLRDEHFVVRMEAQEAAVWGDLVLALLNEAREHLCTKYEVELERPTLLELFHEQKDFAIRTFGLPGGAGFLGVCFGDVITMNSPASQGATPSNWRSVLWHEFAHVVTLRKTRNRMPRWLSEGISVHEERLRNPAWGQSMDRANREWVLSGRATPVSGMGGAFLRPQGPLGLQFAYYQASMVVEYLLEQVGAPTLLAILEDLHEGEPLHRSLARRVAPAEELDAAFEQWFRAQAEAYAPEVEWGIDEEQRPAAEDPAGLEAWLAEHPGDLIASLQLARIRIDGGRLDEAQRLLEDAVDREPGLVGAGSAYSMLRELHQARDDREAEWEVLLRWVAHDDDGLEPRRRMLELAAGEDEPERIAAAVHHALAVQPLSPEVHRLRRRAAEEQGRHAAALAAGGALLALDPVDPAEVHYRRARAAEALEDWALARTEVLRALEQAPRYREALALLLRVVEARDSTEHQR